MSDSDQRNTKQNIINPLLFLSEQLIQLEQGSSSYGNGIVAHVSDDDASPPITTITPTSSSLGLMINDGVFKSVQEIEKDNPMNSTGDDDDDDELHPSTSYSPTMMDEEEQDEEKSSDDSPIQRHPSNLSPTDIGSMMMKAKRAAASLWMVLHAQECRFGGDKCPFKGCLEMKTLLLHVKNCPSNSDHTTCPEQIQGCTQARKLLAHYRRCREIRSLKRTSYHNNHSALSLTSVLSSPSSHSPCLICSLLARHARNVLESTSAASTLASIGSSPPTVKLSCLPIPSTNGTSSSSSTSRFMTKTSMSMPPPPPRPRTCSLGSMPQHPTLLGSTALAQVVPLPSKSFPTAPTNTTNTFSTTITTNLLGKNKTIKSSSVGRRGRPRATSLDDHYHENFLSKNNPSLSSFQISNNDTTSYSSSSDIFHSYSRGIILQNNHNDPTLEFGILDRVRNKEPPLSSINEVELSNSFSS